MTRPILIVGPLSEAVLDKLISDYPHKFARCEPEYMNCDQEALEKVGFIAIVGKSKKFCKNCQIQFMIEIFTLYFI